MLLGVWRAVLMLAALLGIGALLAGAHYCQRFRVAAGQFAVCGHLPAPPSARNIRLLRKLSRFLVWMQVGKIEVVGLENLQIGGPKIIVPNHPHSVDPFVFPLLLPEPARYMTARGVMKFCGGLGGLILGPCGAFCADLRPGKGLPALHSAVRVLTSGQTLVVFPEGWAHLDGITRPFKRGVVHIARKASAQSGCGSLPIVPVFLRHGAHPGPWINHLDPRVQFVLIAFAFPVYRRGLKVVVGAPILASDLPPDEELAARKLRDVIVGLGSESR
jgi:1-acyl-sn-glycerol-3-phosphate acyltransferase